MLLRLIALPLLIYFIIFLWNLVVECTEIHTIHKRRNILKHKHCPRIGASLNKSKPIFINHCSTFSFDKYKNWHCDSPRKNVCACASLRAPTAVSGRSVNLHNRFINKILASETCRPIYVRKQQKLRSC